MSRGDKVFYTVIAVIIGGTIVWAAWLFTFDPFIRLFP